MPIFYPAPIANLSTLSSTTYMVATGGTVTTSGSFKIHTFTSGTGSFDVISLSNTSSLNNAEILVVAGGGGGGGTTKTAGNQYYAGAGGAGGLFYTASYNFNATGSTTAIVGNGGQKATEIISNLFNTSSIGENSVFGTFIAYGGGNVGDSNAGTGGGNGGSGGGANGEQCVAAAGACRFTPGGIATQPTSSTGGFGNNGGAKTDCVQPPCAPPYASRNVSRKGGGGGGAGSAASGPVAGAGLTYNFTGTPTTYAAGGTAVAFNSGSAPIANSGNGGDGFQDGSSGIIIIKYQYTI